MRHPRPADAERSGGLLLHVVQARVKPLVADVGRRRQWPLLAAAARMSRMSCAWLAVGRSTRPAREWACAYVRRSTGTWSASRRRRRGQPPSQAARVLDLVCGIARRRPGQWLGLLGRVEPASHGDRPSARAFAERGRIDSMEGGRARRAQRARRPWVRVRQIPPAGDGRWREGSGERAPGAAARPLVKSCCPGRWRGSSPRITADWVSCSSGRHVTG